MIELVRDYFVPLLTGAIGFAIWFHKYRRRIRWREVRARTKGGAVFYAGTSRGREFRIEFSSTADPSVPWFFLRENERILGRGSISELMEIAERVIRVKRGQRNAASHVARWFARNVSDGEEAL